MPLFLPVFERLPRDGVPLNRVLWILPRIENAAAFKAEWAIHMAADAVLSPMIQTADRMSTANSPLRWWNLKAQVVQALNSNPDLVAGLADEQRWVLAQEYLELAFRLVLTHENQTPSLQDYIRSGHFAEMEARVVVSLAEVYREELQSLLLRPPAFCSSGQIDQVVWFDDGEATPELWLRAWLPELPVQRVALSKVEGPEPWRKLDVANRAILTVAADEATQAQQAAAQVLKWLGEDAEETIVIAVVDRLAARRLVALLAEQGVQVDDRTGWRLSTSRVAGWFNRLMLDWQQTGLLDVVVHPFDNTVCELATTLRADRPARLADWAAGLLNALGTGPIGQALSEDEAGRHLLLGLQQMAMADNQGLEADFTQWLAAWRHWVESQRFRPLDVKSPVRVLPLLATRLREFGRVLVLGCAQSHFQESPPGLLPPNVTIDLGLPGPHLQRIQKISALYDLIQNSRAICLIHCAQVSGRPESLLSELQWLQIVLQQHTPEARLEVALADSRIELPHEPADSLRIQPDELGVRIPEQMPVRALDDWMSCPLRFGLTRCLGWQDTQARRPQSFEQLRGTFVHRVLEKSAISLRQAGEAFADLEDWKRTLQSEAQIVWAGLEESQRLTLYPFMRFFESIIPRLAGRMIQRQAGGWQFESAETPLQGELALPRAGKSIRLSGRADRIDRKGGALGLVDIKFTRPEKLKAQLGKNGDPLALPQLPAYQALLGMAGQAVEELSFLAIHKDKVDWLPFPATAEFEAYEGTSTWGEALFQQVSADLDQFFSQSSSWQATPENGGCAYCAAYGICRPEDLQLEAPDEEVDA
ncbi:PD-(D/E)XK nuclease family protein [Limnobacter litoralis]|uniref:PD-(D/E)XK nuclease family protein n=1 Tax=Limnobacter litoralis TaxID=481366 RepID=UPI0024E0C742|nr:PD-(D/E)XK nuclease family protein [Limnobacter litoralis]